MFKKALYALFVTDRIKLEPKYTTQTALVLYFISFWIALTFEGSIVAFTLFCFMRISVWACIAWLWADILWFNEYSWFRDRRKYP
jgi:hypothetical protein